MLTALQSFATKDVLTTHHSGLHVACACSLTHATAGAALLLIASECASTMNCLCADSLAGAASRVIGEVEHGLEAGVQHIIRTSFDHLLQCGSMRHPPQSVACKQY